MPKIVFDLESTTTEVELLKQVCYRLDRQFPNAESDINLADAMAKATEQVMALSKAIEELGMDEMAATLKELVS